VTLYALLDYIHAGWSDAEIRDWLNLTDEQLSIAHEYITQHRNEVEAEYQEVVRKATDRRRFWEERLRDHLTRNPPPPPSPEKAALYAKLAAQRGRTIRQLLEEETAASKEGATP
jgi:acetylornithine deacetylase/succinyl-diaminopimelate desuccinylase-like protein